MTEPCLFQLPLLLDPEQLDYFGSEVKRISPMLSWSEESICSALASYASRVFVVLDQRELRAAAIFQGVGSETNLLWLVVEQPFRRAGLGTRLLQGAASILLERGVTEIHCEVRMKNLEAQEFYRQLGFRKVGERKEYYTDDDALLLRLDLHILSLEGMSARVPILDPSNIVSR